MKSPPRLSVLMAVFNGGEYLRLAVESVLSQTFTDFELVIVDDGSTDETPGIIELLSARDKRVTPYRNERNSGLIASLNRGLEECKADIVARADADDLFHPDRLRQQYDYLAKHRNVGVLGSAVSFIDSKGNSVARKLHDFPLNADDVRISSMLGCCLWHTTVMFRKMLVDEAGGYQASMAGGPEDYDLWARLLSKTEIVNLPDVLAYQRLHEKSITANWNVGFSLYCDVAKRLLDDYLQRTVSKSDVRSMVALCGCDGDTKEIDVTGGIRLFREVYRTVQKRETHLTRAHFRNKCVNGLMRQATAHVYTRPSLTRQIISTCLTMSPAILGQGNVYSTAARLLTPKFLRNALKSAE